MFPRIPRIAILVFGCAAWTAGSDFYLRPNDRVVILGDSGRTEDDFAVFLEAFTVTRFPASRVEFYQAGFDGQWRRQFASLSPTALVLVPGCAPVEEAAFRRWLAPLVAIANEQPRVRVTAIEPPVCAAGAKAAAPLPRGRFAEAFQTGPRPVTIIGFPWGRADHSGLHAGLLLTEAVLAAWNAPGLVMRTEVDAEARQFTQVRNAAPLELEAGRVVAWSQYESAVPVSLGVLLEDLNQWQVAAFVQRYNQYSIFVRGLPFGRYRLTLNGDYAGSYWSDQFAGGIDLAAMPTPSHHFSQHIFEMILQKRELTVRRRVLLAGSAPADSTEIQAELGRIREAEAIAISELHSEANRKQLRDYELQPESPQ